VVQSNKINIAGRKIGLGEPPFIIAEMSGNHNQSLDRALLLVDAAAKSGAHALKIQTYTPDTMTLNLAEREFLIEDPKSLWAGESLYKLYEKAYTPWEWHKPIFDKARELGLIPFSTPFDETSVEFLENLNTPCYKIASFENTDLPLIRRVAATGKPLIISTGLASLAELDETVNAARSAGCKDLILLKCTSTYPAKSSDTNISTIPHMRDLFGCEVGLSDHTMGVGVAVASIALGATVIEKHFTLSREDGGVDSTFSMEPNEMAQLAVEVERAWNAIGRVTYGATEAEKKSRVFKRSLYIVTDMNAGDVITSKNVRAIRPGLGLPIKYLDVILGRKLKKSAIKGTPLSWEVLE